MENVEYKRLQDLLYEENLELVKNEIESSQDSIFLHIFAGNYNWNNGFDIPQKIINNEKCDLGTALLLFYNADGYRILEDKDELVNSNLDKWKVFLTSLYNMIINKQFQHHNIAFDPPITKVQMFRLKKKVPSIPGIFLEHLTGCDVKIPKL